MGRSDRPGFLATVVEHNHAKSLGSKLFIAVVALAGWRHRGFSESENRNALLRLSMLRCVSPLVGVGMLAQRFDPGVVTP